MTEENLLKKQRKFFTLKFIITFFYTSLACSFLLIVIYFPVVVYFSSIKKINNINNSLEYIPGILSVIFKPEIGYDESENYLTSLGFEKTDLNGIMQAREKQKKYALPLFSDDLWVTYNIPSYKHLDQNEKLILYNDLSKLDFINKVKPDNELISYIKRKGEIKTDDFTWMPSELGLFQVYYNISDEDFKRKFVEAKIPNAYIYPMELLCRECSEGNEPQTAYVGHEIRKELVDRLYPIVQQNQSIIVGSWFTQNNQRLRLVVGLNPRASNNDIIRALNAYNFLELEKDPYNESQLPFSRDNNFAIRVPFGEEEKWIEIFKTSPLIEGAYRDRSLSLN